MLGGVNPGVAALRLGLAEDRFVPRIPSVPQVPSTLSLSARFADSEMTFKAKSQQTRRAYPETGDVCLPC